MAEGEELGSNLLQVLHRRPAELGGLGKVARAAPALPRVQRPRNGHSARGRPSAAKIRAGCSVTTSKLWPLPPSADRRPLPQLKSGDADYHRSLTLRAAGATFGPRQSDPPIEIGSYAQYLKDPKIVQIQFLVGAFLALFSILGRISSVLNAYIFDANGASSHSEDS